MRRLLARLGLASIPGSRRTHSRKVLIFGAGQPGELLVRGMLRRGDYAPIGFVDDDPAQLGRIVAGVPVLGGRGDLPSILQNLEDGELFIASPVEPSVEAPPGIPFTRMDLPAMTLPPTAELTLNNVAVGHVRRFAVEDLLPREPLPPEGGLVRALVEGKRVMVTGAGGSIGSELCRRIAGLHPASLVLFERHENSLHNIAIELGDGVARPVIGDLLDQRRLDEVFERFAPEIVFHTAAHKHVPLMEANVCEAVKNNVAGTRLVIDAAVRHSAAKFVLISSDKAVNPSSVMGATKSVAEMLIQQQHRGDTSCLTVRFGNVLNSNGSVLARFLDQIRAGGPVTVTHPDATRFFMRLSEAVRLVLEAAAFGRGGGVYLLDMGRPMRIVDLARCLIRLEGSSSSIPIEYIGLRPGEKLHEDLVGADEWIEPTSVPHVLDVKREGGPVSDFSSRLASLENAAMSGDAEETLRLLQVLVPEFSSPSRAEHGRSEPVASTGR